MGGKGDNPLIGQIHRFDPGFRSLGTEENIGGRIGTLGFGAEAAFGLSDKLAVRGGLGSYFLEFNSDLDDLEYTIKPPSMVGSVGIDFYPSGGSFRFIGGLMFRNEDFTAESDDISTVGGVEIGDVEYTESGTLHGAISNRTAAPFVGIGFGNHTRGEFGFFLDLGVAFTGDAEFSLEAKGDLANAPGIQTELAKEAQAAEDDFGSYLRFWPILNLGVKIPIG